MAEEPTEDEVVDALTRLASASRACRELLEACRPYVELLADHYPPACDLLISVTVALDGRLGSPKHLERRIQALLAELGAGDPGSRPAADAAAVNRALPQ